MIQTFMKRADVTRQTFDFRRKKQTHLQTVRKPQNDFSKIARGNSSLLSTSGETGRDTKFRDSRRARSENIFPRVGRRN